MTTGVNVNAWGELGGIEFYSELFSIPPANASIGGASYGSTVGPIPPLGGIVVAGLVNAASAFSGSTGAPCPTVEINVTPATLSCHDPIGGDDLRAAFEELRRQMVVEGVPFLNSAELEREIADRKGIRA